MLKVATKCAPNLHELEQAYRAGFRYVELYLNETILADGPALVDRARHYPNEYVLHFPNRLDVAAPALDAAAELYRGLGCRCMVIHQPMIDRFGAELLRRDPGMRLAVENHKLTPAELTAWAERSPGLTLDVEHLWKFTLDDGPLPSLLDAVRGFLDRYGDKLRHVHLPGYVPGFDEHRPMYCSREMVYPVLSLLAEARYDGLIVSEVHTRFQNPHDLRMDVLLFERWRETRDLTGATGPHG